MRNTETAAKMSHCEICEASELHPLAMGIDANDQLHSIIQLCRDCGPIDLELMQICREATVGCGDN